MFQEHSDHIWEVRDEKEYIDGWYFADETEQFNGPFNTKEEAEKNCKEYCRWLDGTHTTEDHEFYELSPRQKYEANYDRIFNK
jgi:hypothetical protein